MRRYCSPNVESHEPALLMDSARRTWAAQLQYHHGVALKEAGKLAEAQAVFAGLSKQFPNAPEAADAALRFGQCLKEEGQQKIDKSIRKLIAPDTKPEEITAAAATKGVETAKSKGQSVKSDSKDDNGWRVDHVAFNLWYGDYGGRAGVYFTPARAAEGRLFSCLCMPITSRQ